MNLSHNRSVLQVNELHFSYPDQQLFSHFSADFSPGITLIRGGDGRGKSTLLKLLAGTLPAQSGQLHINGIDLHLQPAAYKAQVFWAEPRSAAFDQWTVPDYFELQRRSYANFDDSVLTDLTPGLGLQAHLDKQLFMLSTGSKRKVFLAAAFASGAAVTLLDEPFAALDTTSIECVLDWLKDAASKNNRAWLIADYLAPDELLLAQTIDLGD
jgi:ABC-type multidrug transport system ATPase subunit